MATTPRLGVAFSGPWKRWPMQTTVASVGPNKLSTTLLGAAAFHIEADATGSGSPAKKE